MPESVTPSQAANVPPTSDWWVWSAWLQRDATLHFVYGCAAPCPQPATDLNSSLDVAKAGTLLIQERIISAAAFDQLKADLEAGNLALAEANGLRFPTVPMRATRKVIQSCLGYTAASATLFYSLPDLSALFGPGHDGFEELLAALTAELNLPFKEAYAARLGNFEIFEFPGWLAIPQPFLAEAQRNPSDPKQAPEVILLRRTPDFATQKHVAHVSGRAAGDTIVDRLVELPPGETIVTIPVPGQLDSIAFQLFEFPSGTLLHTEELHFINRVSLVMGVLGRQLNLQDDLSAQARGKSKDLAKRASSVGTVSPQRSSVGMPAAGTWRRFADEMQDLVAAQIPKPSEDRWFPRGVEGELAAISHLNNLLNGGQITAAVLVDPWFSAEALRRFALRLGSTGFAFTIVTSWTKSDPDTGQPFAQGLEPAKALETALEQVKQFLNPRLTLINLADGERQAFHDRYLLLRPHEGPPKVFLLSNSLNRIAARYPFAMSLLAPDVGRAVRLYIEGLTRGFDTARDRALDVTLRWPDAP